MTKKKKKKKKRCGNACLASQDIKQKERIEKGYSSAQELCESRGGRPGLPVLNSPYGLCGRKVRLEEQQQIELTASVRKQD